MHLAEIWISAGLFERKRKCLARIENWRGKLLLHAQDIMRDVIPVGPSDDAPNLYPQRLRTKGEIGNLDLGARVI